MEIDSNFSVTRLFTTKEIKIVVNQKQHFILKAKPIKDFFLDDDWNATYHIWTMDPKALAKRLLWNEEQELTSYRVLKRILFDLGPYKEFRKIYSSFVKVLEEILPQLEIKAPDIIVNGITMTDDIWEYVLYLLKLINGEKIEKPLIFSSEEARQFYLAQKAAEEKIKKIKASSGGDQDSLIKCMLSIVYSFPSLTFDYLFEQTMAQIQWLQKNAAGAVSYEVNAQAFAAGNVKKGKKLDFFIK